MLSFDELPLQTVIKIYTVRPGDGHNIKVCSFGFKLKFDNFPIVWFFRAKVYHLNLASFFSIYGVLGSAHSIFGVQITPYEAVSE